MTARLLQKPLLHAGAKIRDKAITMTGTPAWLKPVTVSDRTRYNTKKTVAYGSKELVYLIPDWNEARLALDMLDFSEEEDGGVEAKARMCDQYHEGDIVEFEQEHLSGQATIQTYKVSKIRNAVHNNVMTKSINLVPYRTDNF